MDGSRDADRYIMSVAVSMTGISAYRIRRYEAEGLITPARTAGNQRLFSDGDVARIRELARLQRTGMDLKERARTGGGGSE